MERFAHRTAGHRPAGPFFRGGAAALCRAVAIIGVLLSGAVDAAAQRSPGGPLSEATQNLFDAVHRNDLGAAQSSVAAGAVITAVNDWGLMPVDLAVDKGYFEIAHFLLSLRNFREAAGQAAPAPPQPAPASRPPILQPAPAPPAAALRPDAAAPVEVAGPAPSWPAGQPNPFAPDAATENNIPVIGQVRGPEVATTPPPPAAQPPRTVAPPPAVQAPPTRTPPPAAQPPRAVAPPPAVQAPPTRSPPPAEVAAPRPRKQQRAVATAAPRIRRAGPAASTAGDRAADEPGGFFQRLAKAMRPTPPEKRAGGDLDVEVAQVRLPAPRLPPPADVSREDLDKVALTLGRSAALGKAAPSTPEEPKAGALCVQTAGGATVVCVEPVDWPAEAGRLVKIKSGMYRGTQALVRYDDGKATRLHALFPTQFFHAVVASFTRRFGPPLKTLDRGTAGRTNPTALWMGVDPVTDQVVALEIRKFDDVRGAYPDTVHGAMMLFPAAAAPVFPSLPLLKLEIEMMEPRRAG